MKRNPCKNCPNKGCGTYHDECPEYQEFINYKKLDREDINKNKDFTRSSRKIAKGHWTWGKCKNVGY